MKKIIIINGPNLNLLGNRENNVYGNISLKEIEKNSHEKSKELNLNLFFCQSNNEGEIINFVQSVENNYDGLIINPIHCALNAFRFPDLMNISIINYG